MEVDGSLAAFEKLSLVQEKKEAHEGTQNMDPEIQNGSIQGGPKKLIKALRGLSQSNSDKKQYLS